MFNYTDMIKRAVQYFPKWSDIRKRYNKSLGGQLITTFVNEVSDIETEIQNYIDSYFLQTYIDREDDVIAFIYNSTCLNNSSILTLSLASWILFLLLGA